MRKGDVSDDVNCCVNALEKWSCLRTLMMTHCDHGKKEEKPGMLECSMNHSRVVTRLAVCLCLAVSVLSTYVELYLFFLDDICCAGHQAPCVPCAVQ